jgi:hypothetical protein
LSWLLSLGIAPKAAEETAASGTGLRSGATAEQSPTGARRLVAHQSARWLGGGGRSKPARRPGVGVAEEAAAGGSRVCRGTAEQAARLLLLVSKQAASGVLGLCPEAPATKSCAGSLLWLLLLLLLASKQTTARRAGLGSVSKQTAAARIRGGRAETGG